MMRIFVRAFAAVVFTALPVLADTVVVTGANRGIGLEFVRQYAARNWTVIATARNPSQAGDLNALAARNASIKIEKLDVVDATSIAALAAKYRGTAIDILINNAGAFGEREGQTFGSYDRETLDEVIGVNVFGPLKVSEAFVDHVAAGKQKKIVVISSISGSIAQVNRPPGAAYYSISKAAANMASRGLSKTLAPRGIAVGIYHPGGVDTRMLREAMGQPQAEAQAAIESGAPFPGAFKPLSPEDSVRQLIARIDELDLARSGTFLSYDGQTLPW